MKKSYLLLFVISVFFLSCQTEQKVNQLITFDTGWKFKTGDNLDYAKPDFVDSNWKEINPRRFWEQQGYEGHDGYAWYRTSFYLPSTIKNEAYFKDSVQIILGKIDDTDQTFLNGELIGVNNKPVPPDTEPNNDYIGNPTTYKIPRIYKLSVDDSRLKWDEENVIAIRANDHYINGGMVSEVNQGLSMVDIKDYLLIDNVSAPYSLSGKDQFQKQISVKNIGNESFKGIFFFKVKDVFTDEIVFKKQDELNLNPKEERTFEYDFNVDQSQQFFSVYEFAQEGAPSLVSIEQEIPYILSPPIPEKPRINGAKIYGQRANHPFLYAIPASGAKPIEYSVEGLPKGLELDENTGIITGKVAKEGEYETTLTVKNDKGKASGTLKIVIGDKLALTPPMGWNSWNAFGLNVSDEKVRVAIDQFVEAGLKDHGYAFINIDDGWEAESRTEEGELLSNEKFPDMKALADYAHSKGLKLGIYSSPGPKTCGGYLGSYEHELQDAKTWDRWGIDYLKHDWCSYRQIAKDESLGELQKPYVLMNGCLKAINRDIVYSLCQYGMGDVWKWSEKVGGNLWRTTGDIVDTWASLSSIGFGQAGLSKYAKPGHWNDPDMMIVGWVGWNESIHPTRLTCSEQYTHVSLWAILAAPLLLGNDLAKLDDFTISLLTNTEVIAVNQDPLGKQGDRVLDDGDIQVWVRELEDGSKAVGVFNVSPAMIDYNLDLSDIGFEGQVKIRDIWRNKDIGDFSDSFPTSVLSHGVSFIKVTSK